MPPMTIFRVTRLAFACVTLALVNAQQLSQQWTWIGGSNTTAAADNTFPGSRAYTSSVCFTGSNNCILYGGYSKTPNWDLLGSTWMYAQNTSNWARLSSASTEVGYATGNGTSPGSRGAMTLCPSWDETKMYLFGGYGMTSTGGFYNNNNDLWQFTLASNSWGWLGGSNTSANLSTLPLPARESVCWNVPALPDTIFIHGGNNGSKYYSWLWKFNLTSNTFTFVSGSNTFNDRGDGTYPGARGAHKAFTFKSMPSKAFIYSGKGATLTSSSDNLGVGDLWSFDVLTQKWTWEGGLNSSLPTGVVNGVAVTPGSMEDPAVAPLAHSSNVGLIGFGWGTNASNFVDLRNAIFLFHAPTRKFLWIGGSNITNDNGSGIIPSTRFGPHIFPDQRNKTHIILNVFSGAGTDLGTPNTQWQNLADMWRGVISICPVGQVWNWNTWQCEACPDSAVYAQNVLECSTCPTGATSNNGAATTCGCLSGYYGSSPNTTGCSACAVDTYRSGWTNSSSVCSSCASFSGTNGTTGAGSCMCIPGFFRFSGMCITIGINAYKSDWGDSSSLITQCPTNATTNGTSGATSASACGCPANTFSNDPSIMPCAPCPSGCTRVGWSNATNQVCMNGAAQCVAPSSASSSASSTIVSSSASSSVVQSSSSVASTDVSSTSPVMTPAPTPSNDVSSLLVARTSSTTVMATRSDTATPSSTLSSIPAAKAAAGQSKTLIGGIDNMVVYVSGGAVAAIACVAVARTLFIKGRRTKEANANANPTVFGSVGVSSNGSNMPAPQLQGSIPNPMFTTSAGPNLFSHSQIPGNTVTGNGIGTMSRGGYAPTQSGGIMQQQQQVIAQFSSQPAQGYAVVAPGYTVFEPSVQMGMSTMQNSVAPQTGMSYQAQPQQFMQNYVSMPQEFVVGGQGFEQPYGGMPQMQQGYAPQNYGTMGGGGAGMSMRY